MHIDGIRHWTREQFAAAVDGFDERYRHDFEVWLAAEPKVQAALFGRTLRKWQATRGREMRRTRSERRHAPPYLDDLVRKVPLDVLGGLTTTTIRTRSAAQQQALEEIWATFARLTIDGAAPAKAVGITKAVMLATRGRIGPGLDSNVRGALDIPEPTTAAGWILILEAIADDIGAFSRRNGPLATCVGTRYRHIPDGRLYDMAFGPRQVRVQPPRRSGIDRRHATAPVPVRSLPNRLSAFDGGWYTAAGYDGFVQIRELRTRVADVPNAPGVYVVLRTSDMAPVFRAVSTGGWFKGRNPSVDRSILAARWLPGTDTLYIGKANSLRPRIHALLKFGAGDPVGHWGGRYLWQLGDSEELIIAWQPAREPHTREARLLAEFVYRFGSLPYANLVLPT